MSFQLRCDSFTGGCDTGIAISKKAGMIPLQMELGGKDSCIILEDADLELAATNVIKGGFSYRFVTYAFTTQALWTVYGSAASWIDRTRVPDFPQKFRNLVCVICISLVIVEGYV